MIMSEEHVDLKGQICPYPVVKVIYEVEQMEKDSERIFLVDDPLAIKSIPEELEEYDDMEYSVEKEDDHWKVKITRF